MKFLERVKLVAEIVDLGTRAYGLVVDKRRAAADKDRRIAELERQVTELKARVG